MIRAWCIGGIMLMGVQFASAQRPRITKDDVGRIYAQGRFERVYRTVTGRMGEYVDARGVDELAVPSDTMAGWILDLSDSDRDADSPGPWRGDVEQWQIMSSEERESFRERFGRTDWAFLGNGYLTALDTVATVEIRARMQRRFGDPTRTVGEEGLLGTGPQNLQFEYWFVINDSLPLIVSDVDGPMDRGVITATAHEYRLELYRMRQSLLATMMREELPATFEDRYYNITTATWHVTGFDGTDYFIRPGDRPDPSRIRPGSNR